VVAVGVEQGILLAMALSLARHVRHSYRPHTMMLEPDAGGRWVLVPATPGRVTAPGLIVYRFGSDLFYANQNGFCEEVRALVARAPAPLRWFIVDADAITDIDYSAARSLRDLLDELRREGVQVIFGRVSPYLRADMDRHGITAALGAERIFANLHEAIAAAGLRPPASNLGVEDSRDLLGKAPDVHRLHDVAAATRGRRSLLVAPHGKRGQRDHRDVSQPFVRLQRAREREAVHSGKRDVGHDEIRHAVPQDALRFFGIGRGVDLEAVNLQKLGGQPEIDRIVVNDENMTAHRSSAGAQPGSLR
jgi:anti-anti-sigma regulatory factor